MAKRSADTDLNHENWDREIPSETAGVFQRASNDTIQKRVIKVAKRRSVGGTATDEGAAKNAFSGFQGLKTDKPANDLKSTFSFLNNCQSAGSNGLQSSLLTNNVTTTSSNSFHTTKTPHTNTSTMNMSNSDDNKYPARLIRLNQCVSSWIKTHVDKDPSCILTPIFRDYERYLKDIEEEKNISTSKLEVKDNITKLSTSNFNSTAKTNDNFKFSVTNFKSNPLESDKNSVTGGKSPTDGKSSGYQLFTSKVDKPPVDVSSLFRKPDPKSLLINPFTNKINSSESVGSNNKHDTSTNFTVHSADSSAGFTLGSGKLLTFASSNPPSTDVKENDTNDSDEPPKVEFVPIKEENSVFNKRCKVFIKKDGNYADLGVATLYIKAVAGEKYQLIVRADTSLGNILVNVLLNSSIPVQRLGKNNVMIICVPVPPPEGSKSPPAPTTVLLRVKSGAEADELLSIIDKYKNKQ